MHPPLECKTDSLKGAVCSGPYVIFANLIVGDKNDTQIARESNNGPRLSKVIKLPLNINKQDKRVG
ncbi:hypothetical protein GCM10027566_04900 [Arachidicoccus ginsenosidivorans]